MGDGDLHPQNKEADKEAYMFDGRNHLTARLLVEDIDCRAAPGAMLESLTALAGPVMLDSSALHPNFGRYTVLTCQPVEVLTLRDGVLLNAAGRVLADHDDDAIWAALGQAFSAVKLTGAPHADQRGGYLPGWFGYVGYEIGRHVEKMPSRAVRDTVLPDLRLGFYDAIGIYDATTGRWSLVQLLFDAPPPAAGQAAHTLRRIITSASTCDAEPPPAPTEHADARTLPAAEAESNFTPDQYRQAVAKCVDYIAAGDIFQVNLSQRFTVRDIGDPLVVYQALRRRNPACYAAYMSFESSGKRCAVLSSSPELFLRLRGDDVLTRPIKGTRPRAGDADADTAAAADLLGSEKDNAELTMIIDLLRNDIGRVCRFGSVRVAQRRRLETHPTVFHLVGSVVGRLRDDVGMGQLLRATFPGGSITGAPKVRAMEIIDELEPTARSVYTGCIGTVGVDGSAQWNIAIRTMICEEQTAYVQVGGGIVADSTPQGEYNETLDKARAMLEALQQAKTARAKSL